MRNFDMVMYNDHIVKTVSVTDFKTHCLRLIEEVSRTGEALMLTKRGKKIAKVVPSEIEPKLDTTPGRCASSVIHVGDVLTPVMGMGEFDLESKWF